MRGGFLPPALLSAALALALAFAPKQIRGPSIAIFAATAAIMAFVPLAADLQEHAYLGCWLSIIVTAAMTHLPGGPRERLALSLSFNAGVWAGLVIAFAGSWLDLLRAIPCVLLVVPSAWFVTRGAPIPVKIISSWLIAIAALAALLQFLPVTPGYMPDHLD